MSADLTHLSIGEIRARYAESPELPSPQILARLRRDPRRGVQQIYRILDRRVREERAERERLDAMLNFERVLWRSGVERIAGVDEAGVGPLAGPVVAAAVVFPRDTTIDGIDDSKKLEPERREALAASIREVAGVGVGLADVEEIDRHNVYHAALLAMRRAVEALPEPPDHLLVDAREVPDVPFPQNQFAKGDGINYSIAAASIIAKTERDRMMIEIDRRHPGYGFARHKGYGTSEHQEAIRNRGPCPAHRRSYAFIRELTGQCSTLFYELKDSIEEAAGPRALRPVEKRFEELRERLDDDEQRKLRLTLTRRWKSLSARSPG